MSNQQLAAATPISTGLVANLARSANLDPDEFKKTLMATVMPGQPTEEQFTAFLMVAQKYDLNPITKEIFAFPAKGGIQPIVSIDGWLKIINTHPKFDGMEFKDNLSNGKLESVTCKVFRKDRSHATEVTEYMSECNRGTDPWKKYPARMLRHKATIQAARYAFGFSGIYDPDEAERIEEGLEITGAIGQEPIEIKHYPADQFNKNFPSWETAIRSGKKTAKTVIAMVQSKGALTEDQKQAVLGCEVIEAEEGQ